MKTELFEYPTPFKSELEEMYYPKYRVYDFSTELKAVIYHIFSHPHIKYRKEFVSSHKDWKVRDMLKPAMLLVRYYLDNPQQYANEAQNIAATVLVMMWKQFLAENKHYNKAEYRQYMPTHMKMLKINGIHFITMMVREITEKRYTPMSKMNNKSASLKEGTKHFEYLANLE